VHISTRQLEYQITNRNIEGTIHSLSRTWILLFTRTCTRTVCLRSVYVSFSCLIKIPVFMSVRLRTGGCAGSVVGFCCISLCVAALDTRGVGIILFSHFPSPFILKEAVERFPLLHVVLNLRAYHDDERYSWSRGGDYG
jgi:hypothetical protein